MGHCILQVISALSSSEGVGELAEVVDFLWCSSFVMLFVLFKLSLPANIDFYDYVRYNIKSFLCIALRIYCNSLYFQGTA